MWYQRCKVLTQNFPLQEESPEDQLHSLLFPSACFLPKCTWTHFFHYNFFFSSLVCFPISHPTFYLFSFLSFLFGSLPFLSYEMFVVTALGQPCPTSRFHLPGEDCKIYVFWEFWWWVQTPFPSCQNSFAPCIQSHLILGASSFTEGSVGYWRPGPQENWGPGQSEACLLWSNITEHEQPFFYEEWICFLNCWQRTEAKTCLVWWKTDKWVLYSPKVSELPGDGILCPSLCRKAYLVPKSHSPRALEKWAVDKGCVCSPGSGWRAAPKVQREPQALWLVVRGEAEKALKWRMRLRDVIAPPLPEALVVGLPWPTLLIPIASRRGRRAAPTQIWLDGSYFFSLLCA